MHPTGRKKDYASNELDRATELSILKKVRSKNNLYEQMASGTTLFNQELIKKRAIHSRELRQKHKQKRK